MKRHLYWFASLALGMAACTDADINNSEPQTPEVDNPTEEVASHLTTVNLATFSGDQNRVTYEAGTRADGDDELKPGQLKLIASIANPSKSEGYNFDKETGGRYMSATCVFYDESTQTYYATYHIQGNNYNTTLNNSIGGGIQAFKVSDGGAVQLLDGYRTSDPSQLDFDFNHIYFDDPDSRLSNSGLPKRIITVGHNMKGGNPDNTQAIIAEFDPVNGKLIYAPITTANKIYSQDNKSLGYEDAGDANCVIRVMDYPEYYVATRKGFAVLNSDFTPVFNRDENGFEKEDGTKYFIPTPGSSKFVFDNPEVGSAMMWLYLAEKRNAEEEDLAYTTSSVAKIATFQVATTVNNNTWLGLMAPSGSKEPKTFYDSRDLDLETYIDQVTIPKPISPIDGKNAIYALSLSEYYAALGTSGLYYNFIGAGPQEGVIKFGNRPVNCVVVDRAQVESGHDGFIYVANGSKLTILHRKTMEVVTSYNIPFLDKDGNEVASSANYINVQLGPENNWEPRERTITVAFGQAGLKVFKFMPPKGKTVWEKPDLPTEIN